MEAITTWSSSVQTRISSFFEEVGAVLSGSARHWCRPRPREGLAGVDRQAAGPAFEGAFSGAPGTFGGVHTAGVGHGPLNTQAGSGALAERLAGAMSSLIQPATCVQPAACQSSKGPCFMPKPQRIAKSTSRAVSAMSAGARPRSGSCCAGWTTGTAPAGCCRAQLEPIRSAPSSACGRRSRHRPCRRARSRPWRSRRRMSCRPSCRNRRRSLAQGALLDQAGEHLRGRVEGAVEGSACRLSCMRLDDVGHGVQAHHVGGAEGAAAGARPSFLPVRSSTRSTLDRTSQPLSWWPSSRRCPRGWPRSWACPWPHHALADAGGDEGFQLVEDLAGAWWA